MNTLYVYYQVLADHSPKLQLALLEMQANLRQAMPGLAANLHQRVPNHAASNNNDDCSKPTSQGMLTWMETYFFNGHADTRAWQLLLQKLNQAILQLPEGIDGERHEEWFMPIALQQR